jgi:DNA-directed RNA polymerase specialized sigma24 family protein
MPYFLTRIVNRKARNAYRTRKTIAANHARIWTDVSATISVNASTSEPLV